MYLWVDPPEGTAELFTPLCPDHTAEFALRIGTTPIWTRPLVQEGGPPAPANY